ncbi:hypothetical protein D3C78_1702510 [compost metagenome]
MLTATATLLESAFNTGSVAITAAAPQMLLPAPISIAVWLSIPNTFLPSQQASRKVVLRVNASMMMPVVPTSAIC